MESIFSQEKDDNKPPLTITNKKDFQNLGKCSQRKSETQF